MWSTNDFKFTVVKEMCVCVWSKNDFWMSPDCKTRKKQTRYDSNQNENFLGYLFRWNNVGVTKKRVAVVWIYIKY